MATDISELRRSRDQLEFMANHDILTGLPNRVLLFDRLEHAISRLTRVGGMGAVLFMDVDNFKDVNDNLGHHIGDQLLVGIAQRLNAAIRSSDTVGRLGGDEFLMIAENIGHIDEVLVVIQKVRELFVTPFMIEENEIDVRLSIGIALIPDDGHDAEMLVNAADKAMYAVKKRGRDGFEFYSKHFSMLSHEFFRIQRAIRQAIREDAFVMVYQPQFSIFDGRLSGVEALLRSTHKELKDVPVEKVISIAEESGTIFEISKFVFSAVCEQIAQWSVLSTLPIRIAINLSRLELGNEALVDTVRGNLEACSVVPKTVEFEITESTLMKSSSQARKNIEVLRDLGCNFSIDDFGTGYSSLSNLKEFNLDKLKIDKMFIDSLETDENDQVIVSATISMAKKLGLTVLAEGVETAEQVNLLKKFGCDEVQGFFFSKPVSAEEMTCLLKAVNG
jgi:diguanylate cyclase (GGDEF)-like protein